MDKSLLETVDRLYVRATQPPLNAEALCDANAARRELVEQWPALLERIAAITNERDEARAELERWAKVSSERNHGASGLCCQLRYAEKERADKAEIDLSDARARTSVAVEAQQRAVKERDQLIAGNLDSMRALVRAGIAVMGDRLADKSNDELAKIWVEATAALPVAFHCLTSETIRRLENAK